MALSALPFTNTSLMTARPARPSTSSRLGARPQARALKIVVKAQQDDFQRTPAQQKLKEADDAVRNAQSQLGQSLAGAFAPLGKAIGMGTRSKGPRPVPTAPNTEGRLQWRGIQEYLVECYKASTKGFESIDAATASKLMKKGYVLVDVMPAEDYARHHPTGSVSVPLNQYINNPTSPVQILRKVAFAAQGVKPIEPNPNFEAELKEVASSAKGLIFACNGGGTIRPTTNFPIGQDSRSLRAAFYALAGPEYGNKPVKHLSGGLNRWFQAGFDGEGDEAEWEDTSGKTPFAIGYTPEQDAGELM
mmetsp:Transcript_27772/g.71471  ORF Transcript_27772/g.71471 Transcript_27772/m.71471 type:complete len:304 (+) Transcript_27772:235-1146(+)|eukprot:jgi/Tetstr1/466597/TSEL_011085.t1